MAAALLQRPGGKAVEAGRSYLEHTVSKAFEDVDRSPTSPIAAASTGTSPRPAELEPELVLPDSAMTGSFRTFIELADGVTGANPLHLFGVWLAVVGACIGHSRWGTWSGRVVPIFFSLLIGPTGDHKSTAMNLVLKCLDELRPQVSGVTTDAGLFDTLADADGDPLLLHLDELGYLLQAAKYTGSQLHFYLNDLWGAPAFIDRNLSRRSTGTPPTRRVDRPFVCLVGGTHPDTFWSLLGDDALAISGGFVNRLAPFLVTRGRSLPITEEPDPAAVAELHGHLRKLSTLEPRPLALERLAEERWIDFAMAQDAKLEGLSADLGAVTKRVRDHVARLALVLAVDAGADDVGVEHLDAAIDVGAVLEDGYRQLLAGRQPDRGPRRQAALEEIAVGILRRRAGHAWEAREIIHAWPNKANRPATEELRRVLRGLDDVEVVRGGDTRKERYRFRGAPR